jgi:hypothetical protein
MVVMAALLGAGAVLAAAGALRAVLVMIASLWVLTPATPAVGALRAVPVIAALGAVAPAVSLAADQAVAAVELQAAAGGGYLQEPAGFSSATAAGADLDTDIVAALLALAAFAIAGALRAVGAATAIVIGAARLAGAIDADLVTALRVGAALALAFGVAVLTVRAEVVAWRAAMAVGADLFAALFVGAAFADHSAVALLRFRAVLSIGDAGAALAGFARTAVRGVAAFWDAALSIDTGTATAFVVVAALTGHGAVALLRFRAVLGIWGAGAVLTRFARTAGYAAGAAVLIVRCVEVDTVDANARNITAGLPCWAAADGLADTLDTLPRGTGVWLFSTICGCFTLLCPRMVEACRDGCATDYACEKTLQRRTPRSSLRK